MSDTDSPENKAPDDASPERVSSGAPVFDAPPPDEAPARRSGAWVAVLIAVAVLGGVATATYPQWSPYLDSAMKRGAETTPVQPTPPSTPEPAAVAEVPPPAVPPQTAQPEATQPAPPAAPAAEVSAVPVPAPDPAETAANERLAAALDALAVKLAALDGRLAALEGAPRPDVPDVAPLAAKVSGLEQKIGVLDALAARLDRLERRAAELPAASPRSVAVAALRDALAEGRSYRAAFDAVSALAAGDPGLSALLAAVAGRADTGVPSVPELAAAFEAVAADAARRRPLMAGEGWLDKAVNRLAQLVSVRRLDASGAAGAVDAALARAEAALRTGDLAQAVDALKGLPEPSLAAANDWLADARARVAADDVRVRLGNAGPPPAAKPE